MVVPLLESPAPGTEDVRPLGASLDTWRNCYEFVTSILYTYCGAMSGRKQADQRNAEAAIAGRAHAKALGTGRKVQRTSTAFVSHHTIDMPRTPHEYAPPWLSKDEFDRQKQLYEENKKKAEAFQRQQVDEMHREMKLRAATEAKLKLQELKKEKDAAYQMACAREVAKDFVPPRRRRAVLSGANAQSQSPVTVMAVPPPHQTGETQTVWNSGTDGQPESYQQRANREGDANLLDVDVDAIDLAIRNGLTLVRHKDAFVSVGLVDSEWCTSSRWLSMVCRLKIGTEKTTGRVVLKDDGGQGLEMVGGGQFNMVLRATRDDALPRWSAEQSKGVVVRITRPDITEANCYRYEQVDVVIKEAVCAAYAALNGIGVPLYSIACYEGVTNTRTLRYGSVHMMQKADMDLFRALEADTSTEFAREAALKVVELLYRVARCGVAFFDIKPANILCCIADGNVNFYLTDFDPAFFVRLLHKDYDWKSLLLLNLALLSAHVRNMNGGEGCFEWGRAVAPVLHQLISHREQYSSEWLFAARAVRVEYRLLDDIPLPFDLQAYLSMICTSYFYGTALHKDPALKNLPSNLWKWDRSGESSLKPETFTAKCWPLEWPERWCVSYKPLIAQLVSFATSGQLKAP